MMEIILMRHGRAVEREGYSHADATRPLTRAGIKRLQRALPGLVRLIPHIDLVVTSPLIRARQTAQWVASHYGAPLLEHSALAPEGDANALTDWLVSMSPNIVLMVGHEPDLGQLACWYLTGDREEFISLKKGGVCQLHFTDSAAPAKGELRLLLSAGQLRRLA